jgi:hypothetical protein
LSDCLEKYRWLPDVIANSKLPQVFLDRAAKADLPPDEVEQWGVILTVLASRSQRAKQDILVHGGMQLAATRSFVRLRKALQS